MDNPAPNPAGFAEAASPDLGASLSFVQALRSAASQQQKLQDQQRLEAFNQELKLRQDGYQPAENPTGGTLATGLGQRNPAPDANAQNTIVDPFGRRWYKPTAAAKPDMTLNEALSKGGQPLDSEGKVFLGNSESQLDPSDPRAVGQSLLDRLNGTPDRVAPPAERVVTVEGGKKVYIPDDQQKQDDKDRADAAKQQREHDAQQFTLPDALSSKLEDHAGLPAGTLKGLSVPRSELRALLTSLADKKADAKQLLSGYASKAGNPLQLDKTTGAVSEIQLPAGAKRELTPAQEEQKNRFNQQEQDRQQARDQTRAEQLKQVASAKADNLQKAETQYAKAVSQAVARYHAAVAKSHLQEPAAHEALNAAKDAALKELNLAKKNAQDKYTEGVGILTSAGKGSSQQQAATATNGQQQGGKQTRGPLTDQKIVQGYLQKAKGKKDVARKLARADGWVF